MDDPAGGTCAPVPAVRRPEATTVDATSRLRPMLATPGRPEDVVDGYLHEIKWDGARVLAHLDGEGGLVLRSRSGADVTVSYPELGELADRVDAPTVLDGEVVVLDERGAASFSRLQPRLQLRDPTRVRRAAETAPVLYVVFDVLVCRGRSVLDEPVEERRRMLEELGLHGGRIQVPPSTSDVAQLLEIAAARGDEGVVSKRLGSRYRPGARSTDWIKLPFARERAVVVGAWRPEGASRAAGSTSSRVGAVVVGAYDDEGRLQELGAVGSGLAGRAGVEVQGRLEAADTSPFATELAAKDARFVRPTLVGTVRHRGLTGEGRLRQPVWLGLRDDVAPEDVRLDDPGSTT
jgi:bifunctional non-homologous end joining protein LigD